MKYLYLIIIFLFIVDHTYAQNAPLSQPITLKKKLCPPTLFIGAGVNVPNTVLKKQAYLTSAVNLNISTCYTFIKKKIVSLGINAGGEYSSSSQDQISDLPNPYHIEKETSAVVVLKNSKSGLNSSRGYNKSQSNYKLELGPQLNLKLNKHLIFSLIFQIGYMRLTQSEFAFEQTNSVNGWSYHYTLISQSQTKTQGLITTPKIRIQYNFSHDIGFWIETNYTTGPTIRNTVNIFIPQGYPDSNGQYTLQQMQSGVVKTDPRETKFNTIGINFGLVYKINKQINH